MDQLEDTVFFNLLAVENTQEVTTLRMQNAYKDFIKEIITLNHSETDFSSRFRTLNMTRIELVSLQLLFQYEQKKKCSEKSISTKSNPLSRIRDRAFKTNETNSPIC